MKGIILAAGKGTRLYPATKGLSKPLLPVYDRPMVYYPVAALLGAGITEIMIISSTEDIDGYKRLFGDGSELGIQITYAIQKVQRGIADAFIIARDFIEGDDVCLALGDNIFLGKKFYEELSTFQMPEQGAYIFGYPVEDARPFGVVEFDADHNVKSLEEKPEHPKSNYIVPGLYFYDKDVADIAAELKPSARGELEVTDVNKVYLERQQLKVKLIDDATEWFDAGSAQGLLKASIAAERFERELDEMQCIEEVAYKKGLIGREQFTALIEPLKKTQYGQHLQRVLEASV